MDQPNHRAFVARYTEPSGRRWVAEEVARLETVVPSIDGPAARLVLRFTSEDSLREQRFTRCGPLELDEPRDHRGALPECAADSRGPRANAARRTESPRDAPELEAQRASLRAGADRHRPHKIRVDPRPRCWRTGRDAGRS